MRCQFRFFSREKRVRLAGPDHDAAHADVRGEPDNAGQHRERVLAHVRCRSGDVDIDVRHVERHDLDAARAHDPAQVGKIVCRRAGRPQMPRMHHQLEFAEAEIGKASDAAMGGL